MKLLNITDLKNRGDIQFNRYQKQERLKGATIDFGGAAMLTVVVTTYDEFTDGDFYDEVY